MDRFFSLDSPVMQFLNRMADLVILNMLALLCCLPVITAGASLTAMHHVLLQMVRGEESYVAKTFFRAFASNFKKATAIWVILLAAFGILGADIYISVRTGLVPHFLMVMIGMIVLLVLFVFQWVFPLTARFENTIPRTFLNALFLAVGRFPVTVVMIVMQAAIVWLIMYNTSMLLLLLFIGISGPGYLAAKMYDPVFRDQERRINGEADPEGDAGKTGQGSEAASRGAMEESIFAEQAGITPIPVERKTYGGETDGESSEESSEKS